MKKLYEYKDLKNKEVDEELLQKAIEESQHTCKNCKYRRTKTLSSTNDGYPPRTKDYCKNTEMIRNCNSFLREAKEKFPNIVDTYTDQKPILGYEICLYFESKIEKEL
jgi:hypothetical protein